MCCLQNLTAPGTRMHRGSSLLRGPLAVPALQARPRLLTLQGTARCRFGFRLVLMLKIPEVLKCTVRITACRLGSWTACCMRPKTSSAPGHFQNCAPAAVASMAFCMGSRAALSILPLTYPLGCVLGACATDLHVLQSCRTCALACTAPVRAVLIFCKRSRPRPARMQSSSSW